MRSFHLSLVALFIAACCTSTESPRQSTAGYCPNVLTVAVPYYIIQAPLYIGVPAQSAEPRGAIQDDEMCDTPHIRVNLIRVNMSRRSRRTRSLEQSYRRIIQPSCATYAHGRIKCFADVYERRGQMLQIAPPRL